MNLMLWLVIALWSLGKCILAQTCSDTQEMCYPCCGQPIHSIAIIVVEEGNMKTLNSSEAPSADINVSHGQQFFCETRRQTCSFPYDTIANDCSYLHLECRLQQSADTSCREGNCPNSNYLVLTVSCCTAPLNDEESEMATDTTDIPSGHGGKDNTVAIALSTVFGSLIVVILEALLSVQLIRIYRKKQDRSIPGNNSMMLEREHYPKRPPPYECAVMNSGTHGSSALSPEQPSPYETANGGYAVLGPPDEAHSSVHVGGSSTGPNLYTEHVYEEADKYTRSADSGVVNAEYEVSIKLARPRPLPDYADPDDALFADGKYHTQPKTIKSQHTPTSHCASVKAPISSRCHPAADGDYSIPDDAILDESHTQQPQTKGIDESFTNPVYNELDKKGKGLEKPSSTGVPKKERITVESVSYETTQLKSVNPDPSAGSEGEDTPQSSTSSHAEAHSCLSEGTPQATEEPETQCPPTNTEGKNNGLSPNSLASPGLSGTTVELEAPAQGCSSPGAEPPSQ